MYQTVYVVMREIDYEGSTLVGVYSNEVKAGWVADEYNDSGIIGKCVVYPKDLL